MRKMWVLVKERKMLRVPVRLIYGRGLLRRVVSNLLAVVNAVRIARVCINVRQTWSWVALQYIVTKDRSLSIVKARQSVLVNILY